MEEKRKSFVFYRDWYDAICGLDDKTAIEVVRLIVSCALGEDYESKDKTANSIMCVIRPQIERDIEKWSDVKEKRSIAGKKHKGNQYSRQDNNGTNVPAMEQMEQVSQGWNKMEQNGTNGTVNIYKDTNVSQIDSIDKDNKEEVLDKPKTPKKKDDFDYEKLMRYYNENASGEMPKIQRMSKQRKQNIHARLQEYDEESLYIVIDKCCKSSFLTGSSGWHATFDWLFLPTNFLKVLEGNYDDKNQKDLFSQMPSDDDDMVINGQVYR